MEINLQIANVVFLLAMVVFIVWIVKTIVELMISYADSTLTKARLRQFSKGVKKEEDSNYEKIETLTLYVRKRIFPALQKFMPSLRIDNLEKLEKDIKFIGWEDTFSAESFIAASMILKALGAVLCLLLISMGGDLLFGGLLIFAVCALLLDNMFKSEVKNKTELLYSDFPELIRIISGYLVAGMDLVRSIKESVKYVSDEWKPVLNQFILDCNTVGVSQALDVLKDAVDMFEVREFVALVRLTLEQGGEAKESFLQQADKVAAMQKNQYLIKIGKRKTMATIVQGPALLCNLVILALPVLMDATSVM